MESDAKVLSPDEVARRLKVLEGWKYQQDTLSKELVFGNFSEAVEFVEKIAPFCNKIDHHPDIHIYYKRVLFELSTHSAGGKVTPLDFQVATEIERLYRLDHG